uniref:KH domain-containing protein n=1 Tax=Meloidogyne hapla TaxID=6305 RepID=A0A1I8BRB7_MELHA
MHSTTPLSTNSQLKNNKNNKIGFFSSFLCNYPITTKSPMEINKNIKNKNNNNISSFYSSPKILIPQTSENANNNSSPFPKRSESVNGENTIISENSVETPQQKDNVILTIRMLMQGKDIPATQAGAQKPPITLRLIIPASQCGSLIGKGGSKIREIRDKTGASLQVANEMLSNSTEKPVTISGSSEALIGCMRHVCHILLDSPAKGPTIQYKPLGTLTNILPSSSLALASVANKGGGKLLIGTPPQQPPPALPFIGIPPSLLHQQILLQQLQQQQTQRNIIANNIPLMLPQSLQEQIALLNNQQLSRFLPVTSSSNSQQQTAALLAAASNLNPTLVANNIPNLQEQQISSNGLYKLPQDLSGFDPFTVALLAQQQNGGAIDYVSLLAAQKQLTDPSSINFQHQQQMLLQQHHLNNLLYYQQQSQLQPTNESSNTTNTATTSASVSLPTDSMVLTAAFGGQNNNSSINTNKKKQRFTPY